MGPSREDFDSGASAGPILTMKVADKGKAIPAPAKIDIKSDNASED